MKYALAALVGVLVCAGDLRAQISFGIGFSNKRLSGAVFLGPAPYGPVVPYGYRSSVTSITIYSPPPVPVQPIFIPPPPIVINNNITVAGSDIRDADFPDKVIIRPRERGMAQAPPMPPPQRPLPGEAKGGFRPIRPEDRARAREPFRPPPEPKPPEKPAPKPPPPPNAKDEYARIVNLGTEAFADMEYGRAAGRFEQAIRLTPKEALAYFLLAQAQFALGKYREAVASIHDGLRIKPDWPTSAFRPQRLYGNNAAELAEQLRLLEDALRRHPDDPALLFLLAYQRWFDGREDQARPLFRKARPRVADPHFIDLFLKAEPGVPIVAR